MPRNERFLRYVTWAVAACFLLITAVLVVVPLFGPVAVAAIGAYTYWRHDYEVGCEARTVAATVSPSGRWTAQIRHGNCADFGSGPWVDVALVPNDRPRFLARQRRVFYRDIENPVQGGDRLAAAWIDDHALELRAPPCAPQCTKWDRASKTLRPTGFNPCESECWSVGTEGGVTISIKPPEN
jgi:hypothetical protein